MPGEEYDSYSYISNIISKAKKEIIIIDSYADSTILDILRNIECRKILITSNKSKLTKTAIEKFNKQYKDLKVIKDNSFHDRYFILDRNKTYHCGTSINHAGKTIFTISLLEDAIVKNNLLDYILKII